MKINPENFFQVLNNRCKLGMYQQDPANGRSSRIYAFVKKIFSTLLLLPTVLVDTCRRSFSSLFFSRKDEQTTIPTTSAVFTSQALPDPGKYNKQEKRKQSASSIKIEKKTPPKTLLSEKPKKQKLENSIEQQSYLPCAESVIMMVSAAAFVYLCYSSMSCNQLQKEFSPDELPKTALRALSNLPLEKQIIPAGQIAFWRNVVSSTFTGRIPLKALPFKVSSLSKDNLSAKNAPQKIETPKEKPVLVAPSRRLEKIENHSPLEKQIIPADQIAFSRDVVSSMFTGSTPLKALPFKVSLLPKDNLPTKNAPQKIETPKEKPVPVAPSRQLEKIENHSPLEKQIIPADQIAFSRDVVSSMFTLLGSILFKALPFKVSLLPKDNLPTKNAPQKIKTPKEKPLPDLLSRDFHRSSHSNTSVHFSKNCRFTQEILGERSPSPSTFSRFLNLITETSKHKEIQALSINKIYDCALSYFPSELFYRVQKDLDEVILYTNTKINRWTWQLTSNLYLFSKKLCFEDLPRARFLFRKAVFDGISAITQHKPAATSALSAAGLLNAEGFLFDPYRFTKGFCHSLLEGSSEISKRITIAALNPMIYAMSWGSFLLALDVSAPKNWRVSDRITENHVRTIAKILAAIPILDANTNKNTSGIYQFTKELFSPLASIFSKAISAVTASDTLEDIIEITKNWSEAFFNGLSEMSKYKSGLLPLDSYGFTKGFCNSFLKDSSDTVKRLAIAALNPIVCAFSTGPLLLFFDSFAPRDRRLVSRITRNQALSFIGTLAAAPFLDRNINGNTPRISLFTKAVFSPLLRIFSKDWSDAFFDGLFEMTKYKSRGLISDFHDFTKGFCNSLFQDSSEAVKRLARAAFHPMACIIFAGPFLLFFDSYARENQRLASRITRNQVLPFIGILAAEPLLHISIWNALKKLPAEIGNVRKTARRQEFLANIANGWGPIFDSLIVGNRENNTGLS